MPLRQPPSNFPFPEIRLRFRGGVLCVAVPGMPDTDEAAAAYRDPRAPAGTEGRPGVRGRAGRTAAPPTMGEAPDAAGEFQGTTVRTAIPPEADEEPLYQPRLGLLGQLLREAARARRRIEVTIPPAIGRRNAAHATLERALGSPFRRLRTRRLAALDADFNAAVEEVRGLTGRLAACRVPIRTEFDQGVRDAFVALAEAHDGLCHTGRIWELRPGAGQDARGRHAEGLDPGAAAEAIAAGGGARVPVSFGPARTGLVATALPGVRLTDAEGGALDLFEGFCLLHGPKPRGPDRGETGAPHPVVLDLRDLRVEASAVHLIEDGRMPADAADTVVGHTWARLREDGSPDLHHPGNRRLPVLRYGLLSVRGPEGIDQTYVVSREAAAAGFARAVAQMQAALDALARRSVSSGAPPEPEPEHDPFPQHAGPQRYTPQLKPEPRRDPFLLRRLQHHALPPEPPPTEALFPVASPRAVPPRPTGAAEAGPVARRPDRRRRDRATSAAAARRRRRSGRAILWWGTAAVAMAVLVAVVPSLMEQWRVDAPSAIAPPPERPPPEPVTQAVPIQPPHPGAAPPGSAAPERRADDAPGSSMPAAPGPAAGSPVVTPPPSPADVALLPLPPDPPPSPPPPPQDQATGASALPMPPPPPPPAPPEAPPAQAAQQPPAPAPAPVQAAVPGSRIAMAQGANVHAAPGGGAPVLRTVNSGTRVLIFARQGNWLQIGDGDQPWGWVHTSRADRGG
jgi:hypothetical protein